MVPSLKNSKNDRYFLTLQIKKKDQKDQYSIRVVPITYHKYEILFTDEFIGLKNSSESAQFWFLLGTFLLPIGY